MKFEMRRMALAAVIFTTLALSLAGCRKQGREEAAPEQITTVITTHPAPHKIVRRVRFTGSLKGSREVMVYPTLPGKLIGYTLTDGAYVSKGGTVARIDRDVPGVSYEPVPVEAPISGRFFSMGLSPGEAVAPQRPLGHIAETSRLKLAFEVPEKYVSSVRQGSRAELYVPSIDYRTTAVLTRVSRFVDARSGAAQAEATVSNPGGRLTPGMYAEINVSVASKDAVLALPVDCVLGLDGKFCYVVSEEDVETDTSVVMREGVADTVIRSRRTGRASKRDVEVGLDDGSFIEILSGLEASDEVLYVGQRIVEEGGKIVIDTVYTFTESADD